MALKPPAAQTPAPAGATFAAPRRAERRQVTGLFCDIVGSVELTSRLDPEDMMHLIDVYFAACNRVIGEHGGYVFGYMGDGVLAYFGYPRANEDDAVNAVRAGLALRDAVAGLDLPMGIRFQVRIGIATGLVVVSDLVGQGNREAGLVGETPNLAARLQSIAAPDSVVVARSTQGLADGFFAFRDLGSFTLKGFAAPVEAAEAIEETTTPNRFLARARGKITPLVGREPEMKRILGCWAAARAGHGQIVLLRGEAGIGKSRLVRELRSHAAEMPHSQTVWHCGPNYGDSTLYPVAQQLGRAAGFAASDSATQRRDKLDGLLTTYRETDPIGRSILADLLGLPPEDASPIAAMLPEKRREATLNTLLGMMQRQAGDGAALLVLEDAHWADATTLQLLETVIARAAGQSWLIMVTARPEFEPDWLDGPGVTHITLSRLNLAAAERLSAHLGADLLPPETMSQIVARSDGVPLFVEELTKSVLEAVAGGGVAPISVPMSVMDSLTARLDRLGPARRVANLGAAIGRRFSYELVAAVAAQPEAELRQSLRDLSFSGLVESNGLPPSSSYVFKHALIRDAAYESLLKRERQALHGQIANALRDRFPQTRETEPELLAYHFSESGAIDEAVPLWAEAGNRAAARAAHVEATGHLRTALDLVRRGPPGLARATAELPLLLGLGVSLSASHGYHAPEVGEFFGQAQGICNALGNPAALLPVLIGITSFRCLIGEMAAAEDVARQCLAIADQTGLAEHRMVADSYLGYMLAVRGRIPEARQRLENAAAIYRGRNQAHPDIDTTQDSLVHSRGTLLSVLYALGDREAADTLAEDVIIHARSLGRPYDLVFGLSLRANYLMFMKKDPAACYRDAEELLRLCETHGYSMWRGIGLIWKGVALGHLQSPSEGLPLIREGMAEVERTGHKHGISAWYCHGVACMHATHNDFTAALASIDEGLMRALDVGDELFLPELHLTRAKILAAMSDGGAGAEARRALAIAEAQGAAGYVADACQWLEAYGAPIMAA